MGDDLIAKFRLEAEAKRRAGEKFSRYFPDCKPACKPDSMDPKDHVWCCRVLYPRHVLFMDQGRIHRERLFLAANRLGKSDCAAFESTAHVTGEYPHWWTGRRFEKPVRMWVAGDTMLSTRDILQVAMLGPIDNLDIRHWTGMLPQHAVLDFSRKSGGISDCVDQIIVSHASGGKSVVEFKSYDQGRRLFQGTEQELIWLDEEAPEDVYAECLTRTMTTNGLILYTFTPLQGLTPGLQHYLETAVMPDDKGELRSAYEIFFPAGQAA